MKAAQLSDVAAQRAMGRRISLGNQDIGNLIGAESPVSDGAAVTGPKVFATALLAESPVIVRDLATGLPYSLQDLPRRFSPVLLLELPILVINFDVRAKLPEEGPNMGRWKA
jgi:hypothetical protein